MNYVLLILLMGERMGYEMNWSKVGIGMKDLQAMILLREKLDEKGISLQRAIIEWDENLQLWEFEFFDPSGSVGFIAAAGFLSWDKTTSIGELVEKTLSKLRPERAVVSARRQIRRGDGEETNN